MRRPALLPLLALLAACGEVAIDPAGPSEGPSPSLSAAADEINTELAREGAEYLLYKADYFTAGTDSRLGRTVYFNVVGNKRTDSHWVPGDPRRVWGDPGGGISYIIDGNEGATTSGLSQEQTSSAIQRAMSTWEAVRCSTIPLVDYGVVPFDLGITQALAGMGGVLGLAADVTHAGFLPGPFFDLVEPGGSEFILGVTYTYSFVDEQDEFTDVDRNRFWDTAFTETYFNDAFPWHIGSTYDVETVALHETGHSLSQSHFGKAFQTDRNQRVHFAPRAVMNSAYSGVQTRIGRSDNAGHCTIWSRW
jgi:hypothetical protein